jgi:3-methylfumaryl-CoA hydratase
MMDWTPTTIEQHDDLVAAPLHRLAALFDTDAAHWPAGVLPPLAHWLYFLPDAPQSSLGADGHAAHGLLLPPIDAPRRMWAGGRLTFHAPLPVGARATRRSIAAVPVVKHGRSGTLTFVTVTHEIVVDGAVAVTEEQDLVFRAPGPGTPPPATPDPRTPEDRRELVPTETALFRFSALTNNAHRIHYDRDYATGEEHYPDLVVHGPLQAMLLADHLMRAQPGVAFADFAFRGLRPLFVNRAMALNRIGGTLWTTDHDGGTGMEAQATLR